MVALVSPEESAIVTARAEAAGMSVGAYVRARLLDDNAGADAEALAMVDQLIAGMETRLDDAMQAVDAAMDRMDAAPGPRGKA